MPDTVSVTRWEHEDPPNEGEIYFLMEQAGFSPTLRGEPAGTRVKVRMHPFPKVCWVVSGWVRFTFPGATADGEIKDVVLKAGDRVEIPAEVPHTTFVEGASYAVYLTSSPWSLPIAAHPDSVNI
jgi:hypothetical protein